VLHQWGLIRGKDSVEQINKKRGKIIHKISTNQGQSGSAIFLIDKEGNFSIVGVHKGEVDGKGCNVGRLLTEELIDKLKAEAEKLGALPFRKPEENSSKQKEIGQPIIEGGNKSRASTLFQ
jgi:hypothetical protein